ncbi:peptidoglycan DD-metalloendopeptidase family protein [Thalassotalea piscium]|uniref:Murein DD-endopeptidase MepM/ murein hydrolase activator NlpD n=1 Tax=Thalassotalea piscium TaxID=1230533 RepID=A0A7X0NI09_9GAMM|nr:peptidoglycan DD-metalloendopeptidase family protein [Thalassotalea piscium]MBB6543681.1 murein DD-endopeptidase MepM/ murein hydrolase activator NlpD [Thalassotalea piscium]
MKNIKNLYIQLPKKHQLVISIISIMLLLLILLPSEKATASRQTADNSLKVGQRYQLALPEDSEISTHQADNNQDNSGQDDNFLDISEQFNWQSAKVRNGDSLAKIFKRLGFNAQTTYKVSTVEGEASNQLKRLQVGDVLRIGTNDKKELAALEYPISQTKTLFVNLIDGKYQAHFEEKTVEIQESIAHGIIKSSFWNAGIESGLNDAQIINLANIFGWDIDFGIDIRQGDTFHVVYENKYIDGEFIGTGKILAAEFVNQDDPFQAIRFTDGEYYTPDGKSMRKAFLRAPVSFKYISSNFKPKRFHPVQKRWKAHRGTDYAAKTGTPVLAAGNGKVVRASYDKYNGHHVFIQHGNGIETKYIHFSKRAVKKGQRVKQGQVIGYVGSTGLASGPHLHYEFLLNGVHRNPRTVKLPDAQPIDNKYKADFTLVAEQRLKELSGSRQALLAANGILPVEGKNRLQAP